MMNPWPTVNQAYMLIKQEEKQRQTAGTSTPIAMMVNIPNSKPSTSFSNNQRAFDKSSGSGNSGSGNSAVPLECSYCHGKNHTKDKCYKLIGYPNDNPYHPQNRGRKKPFVKNSNSGQALQASIEVVPTSSVTPHDWNTQMEVLQSQMNSLKQSFSQGNFSGFPASSSSLAYGNNVVTVPNTMPSSFLTQNNIEGTTYCLMYVSALNTDVWILDTGAKNHMCCNSTDLQDLTPLSEPITVKFPNGDTSLVTHNGSVFLKHIVVTIPEVLLVPSFKFNLLSIRKLASQTKSLICFNGTECLMQGQH